MSDAPVDAIVLAGGRSRRMQGQDKLGALVGDMPLLARVVAACAAVPGTQQIVVAAGKGADGVALRSAHLSQLPSAVRAKVALVVDDPSRDGPVAGLAAALAEATAPIVLVVAGDMPFVTAGTLSQLAWVLATTNAEETWLAMAVDAEGHRQFACCAWRRERLSALLAAESGTHGEGRDMALKTLVRPAEAQGRVRLVELDDPAALLDVDDAAGLQLARQMDAERPSDGTGPQPPIWDMVRGG